MAFFVLQNPDNVAGAPYLNSNKEAQCVEFVRKVTCAPATQFWRQGMKVQGNESKIPRGTAIATFIDGRYPSKKTGNHAAIFLKKTHDGIEVMDQYRSKGKISPRIIRYKSAEAIEAEKKRGKYSPSNDATSYSVIKVEEGQGLQCD